MRTIALVLITFVALSLSPTAARAGANGSWCANYGTGHGGGINCSYTSFRAMPRDRVGHLWVLHAKSVPRNGLWERRDLEFDAYEPRSLLPSRALNPFGGGARASDATRPLIRGGRGYAPDPND